MDFGTIFKAARQRAAGSRRATTGVLTTICLLLFTGAIGKSAQLPLYVWLPDAMEGPTPVSALIHAATMVTAGVYMIARMNPLFSRAPLAMFVVALIGALTAFYAATIGLVQTDIKKVLAYSTVSQLGYMFLGLRRRRLRCRHLPPDDPRLLQGPALPRRRQRDSRHGRRTGHAAHGRPAQQNSHHLLDDVHRHARHRRNSRLRRILQQGRNSRSCRAASNPFLWALGLLGAGLTSFYMFRLIFLTFFGKPRYDEHKVHVHESPHSMTVPLIFLAIPLDLRRLVRRAAPGRRPGLLREISASGIRRLRAGDRCSRARMLRPSRVGDSPPE